MISISIIILLFQILNHLPNVQSSISGSKSYDDLPQSQSHPETHIGFETHARRTSSPSPTLKCLVEEESSQPSPPGNGNGNGNGFTATTNCIDANVGETCTYSCSPPYFLDSLIPSMLTSRIPGFGNELITLNPSSRYCSERQTLDGNSKAEWYQPVGDAYKQPQCLSQGVYDKLILCTNETSTTPMLATLCDNVLFKTR